MNSAFLAAALTASPIALTASTIAPAPVAAPALPDAEPALWVVNDEDTIIYLFGTFHALDGKTDWFNDEVKTAFAGSDQLVLETLVPAPPKMLESEPPAPGMAMAPVGPFAGSASFLTSSKTVMSAGRSQGMSTDQGADAILRTAAEEAGKPVHALESFDFQIRMFSRMPGASAPSNPVAAARSKAALGTLLTRLQAAWNRGDIDSFAPMLDQMQAKSPETYRLLFRDRNARWAQWIARRMQQPGVVFVAVGAGHLAGRDSLQVKLAQMNIRSQRIN